MGFVQAVSRLFFSLPNRSSQRHITTTKLENVGDNPRVILEILDDSESESDNESIFSGDSNNNLPQENEDSVENNGTDGEQSVNDEDKDDEPPSTDGWSTVANRTS